MLSSSICDLASASWAPGVSVCTTGTGLIIFIVNSKIRSFWECVVSWNKKFVYPWIQSMYLKQLRCACEVSFNSCPETSIYPFLRPSFHLDALLECLCDNEMRLPATLPFETNEKHSLLLFRYLTIVVPPRHPYAPPFQDEHPWSSLPSCPPALFKTVYKCGTHNLSQFFSEMGLCPLEKRKHFTFASLCYALDSEPSSMGC